LSVAGREVSPMKFRSCAPAITYRDRRASKKGSSKAKVAAVALANKIARTVWAMMMTGERYREPLAV
jgi:hypothetical protein